MSKYDETKDICIKKWQSGNGNGDLVVGVYSYNNGEPKVGFHRYREDWKTKELKIFSAGRLTWDDLEYLESIWEEMKEIMETEVGKESYKKKDDSEV